MYDFLLLLRENPQTFKGLSANEMQAIIERYGAWAERLGRDGKLKGGEKLKDTGGKVLRAGAQGAVVSDGPYAEVKDVVSGYFVISAADWAEAQSIAASCPHMSYGWIELREIEPVG
jgi:hypothetical protein